MCGRYMFQPDKNPEIKRIYQLAVAGGYTPKTGEVFPTDETALIIAGERQVKVVTMKWGFPGFKAGQSLINARSDLLTHLENAVVCILRLVFSNGVKRNKSINSILVMTRKHYLLLAVIIILKMYHKVFYLRPSPMNQ